MLRCGTRGSLTAAGTAEILAAVLPCTWSYGAIAQEVYPTASDHPIYREWLGFYAGPQYSEVVENMRREIDERVVTATADEHERLSAIFTTGVRFERDFWDMAYAVSSTNSAAKPHAD